MANPGMFKNIRVYWIAFVVYWGIILFGYDTGVAGAVVGSSFFQQSFGLLDESGKLNKKKSDEISSNVVSVLQAGAFFGALGSAPISGELAPAPTPARTPPSILIAPLAKIGRRSTLMLFSAIFLIGAVPPSADRFPLLQILTVVANGGSKGLSEIYAGRVIIGLGIGGISAVSPAYVSECSPKEVRGRITGLFQIFVATGVALSYWVNYGIQVTQQPGPVYWRIPFGLQLVPAGIMCLGLFTLKESPRWLASVGRAEEALHNLAYLRREPPTSDAVLHEFAEIEAAIQEEQEARAGLGWKEAFFGKGNFIRFVIAFTIFMLQQWGGQNAINYYSPQIFAQLGYVNRKSSLLATGVYGLVKLGATSLFIFFGVDWLGRKPSFIISAYGMGVCWFIIGALLKTHPVPPGTANAPSTPPASSQAMAAVIYIFVIFYSMGWGPLPWVYCADIFPTRTRHYGLAVASASQWLFNFMLTKLTLQIQTALGYKFFFMFGTINILGLGTFSLLIPETKGRSLEDMDVIFGAVSAEKRAKDIERQQKALDEGGPAAAAVPVHASGDDRDRESASDARASQEKV
ncbi:Sugar transporter [Mycena kentingensis (nom. inval.)]|nr:Sugar transporter [Mycena kentingensis (nom. inval.)]